VKGVKMPERKRGSIDRIGGRVRETYESAKEKAADAKDKVEDVIKERPITSIAVAAAVGALVALGVNALFKEKKRSSWDKFRDYF
jgi:ElaB/YqjD/DUF883 family membrane-anchored ribosome-binding protein